ncbi:dihydroxyacetone kinase subunit DhaL [Litorihabitans aurantiacus]|uniref:Dihydroxyacetone kinase subunit L n=1 Tax=Litorihabitans aurantiacus TaxID=1930061 RepID=A0AA37XFM5_9MICO|nr:dihydroxyacetone kinase subunit DhaL [Litorihabitans aurantiacus]GMA31835.1 dihydroxyacetone kinase subunit L [Litorihabitans aurantiacus]
MSTPETPGDGGDAPVLDVAWALRFVALAAQEVAQQRVELSELDRAIGDGDHGENLARGFGAVTAALEKADPATVGAVLKLVATTLMSTVGGAAGPLYGTAFLRAAKVSDAPTIDAQGVVSLIDAALEGVVSRGRAKVGDKTMVDAWHPALEAASRAADDGDPPAAVLARAAEAAEAGAAATDDLVALKGRASYLGERSRGHRDPGAASSALLLRAAARAVTP